jgi:hypothetical protein
MYLFQLVKDHVASVRDCVRKNNFGHLLHVRLPGSGVPRIVVTQSAVVTSGKPARKSSCVCFSVDIWPRTEDDIEAQILGYLEKSLKVVSSSLEIQNTVFGRVPAPISVDTECIEAPCLLEED